MQAAPAAESGMLEGLSGPAPQEGAPDRSPRPGLPQGQMKEARPAPQCHLGGWTSLFRTPALLGCGTGHELQAAQEDLGVRSMPRGPSSSKTWSHPLRGCSFGACPSFLWGPPLVEGSASVLQKLPLSRGGSGTPRPRRSSRMRQL